jgi:hypothetical protein
MGRLLAAFLIATLVGLVPGSPVEARKRKPRAAAKQQPEGEGTMKIKVHDGEVDEDKSPTQSYAGVTVNGGGEPPETKPPPAGLQAVTWPGFKADKSGSEVFLQLTGQVTYHQKAKGHRISITLDKTVVPLRNNLRPMITRNFRSPVASFRLRPAGADSVRLDITLRRKAEPSVSMQNRGKHTFLVVAFPPVTASK